MLLKFNCNHKEIMKEEAYKVLPDILKELINVVYRVVDEFSLSFSKKSYFMEK